MSRSPAILVALALAAATYAGMVLVSSGPGHARLLGLVGYPVILVLSAVLTWSLGRRRATLRHVRTVLLAAIGLALIGAAFFLASSMSAMALVASVLTYAPILGGATGWLLVAPRQQPQRALGHSGRGRLVISCGAAIILLSFALYVTQGYCEPGDGPLSTAASLAMLAGVGLISVGYWGRDRLLSALFALGAAAFALAAGGRLAGSDTLARIATVIAGGFLLTSLLILFWRRLGVPRGLDSGHPAAAEPTRDPAQEGE